MELATGVDLIRISRIEKSITNPLFLTRVYGTQELDYYAVKKSIFFLAGNFAAKEAFSKVLGTGIRGFSLSEVEVLRDELGAPYYFFTGNAARLVAQKQLTLSLSISHDGDYAVAFAVGFTK